MRSDVPARLGLGAPALARPEGASAFSYPWPSQGQCRGPGSGLARPQAVAFSKPSTVVKPRLGGLILCRQRVTTYILSALHYHGPANRTCAPLYLLCYSIFELLLALLSSTISGTPRYSILTNGCSTEFWSVMNLAQAKASTYLRIATKGTCSVVPVGRSSGITLGEHNGKAEGGEDKKRIQPDT